MKIKKAFKNIAVIFMLLIVVTGIVFYLYTRDYYHAEAQNFVAAEETKDYIIYGERDSECGLIFYPGAKVEECAYAPILSMLADNGICCVVVKMPFHLAVLHSDAAKQVVAEIPTIENWYIGGHSLGGAMAADYAATYRSEKMQGKNFKGLILLAAYPTKEIYMPVLSIYGSEDNVLNHEKYQSTRAYANSLTEYVLEGGNHAYFGNYGEQKGDGKAAITKEEQWQETVDDILDFLHKTGGLTDEGDMHWIKKEELSSVNLVSDFYELLQVMLDDNLNEFQYINEDDQWKIVLK